MTPEIPSTPKKRNIVICLDELLFIADCSCFMECRKVSQDVAKRRHILFSLANCHIRLPDLRVRPPGIDWTTGRNPKIGRKKTNGPRPEMQ